jgi:hypothetical protein
MLPIAGAHICQKENFKMTRLFVVGALALLFGGSIAFASEEHQHGHAASAQHDRAKAGAYHGGGSHHHGGGYDGGDYDNGGGFYCGPAQIALGLCNLGD